MDFAIDILKLMSLVQNVELDPKDVSIQGLYVDKRNKVITIPDVFHQLHCLVSKRDRSNR